MFKASILFAIFFLSINSFSQVHCYRPGDNSFFRNEVASHYSPYFDTVFISNISTIILGASMPVNKEEIQKNYVSYLILGTYGLIQTIGVQTVACGRRSILKPPDDFFKVENIDSDYYNRDKKYFWWSYGLNVAALSYMASISAKDDRWQRVEAAIAIPWIFDLLVNRIFYSYKYQLYENPVFINIKPDDERKEDIVSFNYRFSINL